MFDIIFPAYNAQHYWNTHYTYVLNIFKALHCQIKFELNPYFVVSINGQKVLFDYADTSDIPDCPIKIFKFHSHIYTEKVIPFSPISFYDWEQYKTLETQIQYKGESDIISYKQRAYATASIRRQKVQDILKNNFRDCLLMNHTSQVHYWQEINDIFLAVFVPGFCNNMLDRAALQYMGLGCPIITTEIPEYLPYYEKLIAGKHYIKCSNDYSDLVSIIKSYQTLNKHKLQEIGENAKELFQRTCTPVKIGQWIAQNL